VLGALTGAALTGAGEVSGEADPDPAEVIIVDGALLAAVLLVDVALTATCVPVEDPLPFPPVPPEPEPEPDPAPRGR
jgi:hypothetical protein